MSEKDNFQFFGFPENTEIEIPDEKTEPSHRNVGFGHPKDFLKDLSNMSPEDLKNALPPEAIEEIEEIANQQGVSVDDMLKDCSIVSRRLMNGGMESILSLFGDIMSDVCAGLEDDDYDDDCDDCNDCGRPHYELGDGKYLRPEYFGAVECVEDENLYDNFIAKYGLDSTKYLDSNYGLKDFAYTPITANLPLQNIKNLKFMEATNKFILFYAEPDIPDTYGFFVSIVKNDKDDYTLYIPEFKNTFNVDDSGNVTLFNPAENPALFSIDSNGVACFDYIDIPSIEFAINFALAPKKRVLLSPHQFGTIKNTMPSVTRDSSFLKVGMITSNELPDSILLKKDAELDLDETTFPLYFNFGRVIEAASLREIASILFKTNLNECRLLDFCELKYTNDHLLYIDIDIGDF